jgi:hypothetical protein
MPERLTDEGCMYACMHVCMCVCVCVCVCMYVCVYVCMYVCMLCMYVCMYTAAAARAWLLAGCLPAAVHVSKRRVCIHAVWRMTGWLRGRYTCAGLLADHLAGWLDGLSSCGRCLSLLAVRSIEATHRSMHMPYTCALTWHGMAGR